MHIDKDLVHLFLSDMIQISTVQNPSKLLKVIVNNLDSNGMNLLLKLKQDPVYNYDGFKERDIVMIPWSKFNDLKPHQASHSDLIDYNLLIDDCVIGKVKHSGGWKSSEHNMWATTMTLDVLVGPETLVEVSMPSYLLEKVSKSKADELFLYEKFK
tara:strand:+ start:18115 stop:18582 length:468 start_codon:yes stop_codon:yes gene_type:complete